MDDAFVMGEHSDEKTLTGRWRHEASKANSYSSADYNDFNKAVNTINNSEIMFRSISPIPG